MSEQWHDDHKKAIAEKWTQCPPVTTKVKELIGDEVCMGTYGLVELEVMQLETELAEARADNECKNKLLSVVGAVANNALYFNDNSDYESALWNILAAAKPELFAESDMPKLKFMPGNAAERGE